MHRADAQPPDRERRQPVGRVRSNEPARRLAADGEQRGDAAPPSSRARANRTAPSERGIQPLDVVDREAERGPRSEGRSVARNAAATARSSDFPSVSPSSSALSSAPPLDRRQGGSTSSTTSPSEIGQPGVREARLRLGRPGGQRPIPALGRRLEPGQPDRASCRSPPRPTARRSPGAARDRRAAGRSPRASSSLPIGARTVVDTSEYPAPPWRTSSSCPISARG